MCLLALESLSFSKQNINIRAGNEAISIGFYFPVKYYKCRCALKHGHISVVGYKIYRCKVQSKNETTTVMIFNKLILALIPSEWLFTTYWMWMVWNVILILQILFAFGVVNKQIQKLLPALLEGHLVICMHYIRPSHIISVKTDRPINVTDWIQDNLSTGGWQSGENRPLVFLSNLHEPEGKHFCKVLTLLASVWERDARQRGSIQLSSHYVSIEMAL